MRRAGLRFVFLWSGDFEAASDYVERLIEYARRHSIEPYRAAGLGLTGALAIARDEAEILSAKKLNILLTLFAGTLAEGSRTTGQAEEASSRSMVQSRARHIVDRRTTCPNFCGSKRSEAIEVARVQSARALELRSTMTLARLLAEGERRDQARHKLGFVYDRFTEGFQTEDLRLAHALLENLQPSS